MWGNKKNVEEIESADKKFQKELVSGVAALVLLTILDKAAEPMYGYQIAKVIDGLSAVAEIATTDTPPEHDENVEQETLDIV